MYLEDTYYPVDSTVVFGTTFDANSTGIPIDVCPAEHVRCSIK
jgi:hypothetical protein